jgi:hypothetical protein
MMSARKSQKSALKGRKSSPVNAKRRHSFEGLRVKYCHLKITDSPRHAN